MSKIISNLSQLERQTIGECLRATTFGDFFPDWEFETLFGVSRNKVKKIAEQWPNVDWGDQYIRAIIINSLGQLLGYPHGQEQLWSEYITVSPEEVKKTLDKLLGKKDKGHNPLTSV